MAAKKKITPGAVVSVAIGKKHLGTRIGDVEWLNGTVLEVLEGGKLRVKMQFDPTMHGRMVDSAGNFVLTDDERRVMGTVGECIRDVDELPPGSRDAINVWALSEKQAAKLPEE